MAERRPIPVWQWFALTAMFLPLIGIAVFMAVRENEQWKEQRAAFGAHIEEYSISGRQPDANSARIALGKLVVINLDERKLDDLHFDIPDGMRADSPNEVVTVVQTRPIKHKVGQYEGGGRAIREDYPITVIDKASSTILGSATFEGPNPPESTSRTNFREDVSGGPPKAEIIEYLRQLR